MNGELVFVVCGTFEISSLMPLTAVAHHVGVTQAWQFGFSNLKVIPVKIVRTSRTFWRVNFN